MRKKSGLKKFLAFIIAFMMTLSPMFLTGCFWDSSSNNSNLQPANNQTNPSGGTTGGAGGSTTNGGTNSQTEEQETRPSLEYEEYDQYFKNYRVTYQTDKNNRNDFNKQVSTQNLQVAESILTGLNKEYYCNSAMFETSDYNIQSIDVNNGKVLAYNGTDNLNYNVEFTADEDSYRLYFSHILGEQEINYGKNKLTIAITLILQGYDVLDENDNKSSDFEIEFYSQCNALLNGDSIKNLDDFENLANSVSHLGFTDRDVQQIENFVLHYIIGTTNVQQDDSKFVNCYYDISGGNPEIKVKYYAGDAKYINVKYNKFLTDETYATGYLKNTNNNVEFGLNGSSDMNLQGLLHYSGYYLASLNENIINFEATKLVVDSYIGDYNEITEKITDVTNYPAGTLIPAVTSAIYNKLIKIDSVRNSFNANVWKYDSYGNKNSENAGNLVIDTDGHVLFSVRLPGFKNFTNTVHKIVNNEVAQAPTQEYLDDWLDEYGYEYPYKDAETGEYIKYPNIPYTYFADYDNGDMLFDGESGAARMFSGFKLYQNLVLMPQSDVDVESGALFVVRKLVEDETHYPDGSTDHSGDFEMTVYVRYYDAATQSYATWTDEETGETTQFYKIGTETIDYNMYITEDIDEEALENAETDEDIENAKSFKANYAPVTFDFSIKDILLSAQINGQDNESWTLEAFDDGRELCLHNQKLVTKYNYGECFKEDKTPEGDKVVVYDGKSAGSSSYFELVFSCSRAVPFQFCFYPTVAYAPK